MSWAEYCRLEEAKQRRLRLVSFPTDDSRLIWLAEAFRRWDGHPRPTSTAQTNADDGASSAQQADLSDAQAQELRRVANNLLPEAALTQAAQELRASKRLTQMEICSVEGRFPHLDELEHSLSFIEVTLMLMHFFPSDPILTATLNKLRPSIDVFKKNPKLYKRFEHSNTLFELWSFRRLLSRWDALPESHKTQAAIAGAAVAGQYNDIAEYVALRKALSVEKKAETDLTQEPSLSQLPSAGGLLKLVENAAKATPIIFKSTAETVQLRVPDWTPIFVTATGSKTAHSPKGSGAPPQGPAPAVRPTTADNSGSPQGNLGHRDMADPPPRATVAVKQARSQSPSTADILEGNWFSDGPSSKRQRIDLVAPDARIASGSRPAGAAATPAAVYVRPNAVTTPRTDNPFAPPSAVRSLQRPSASSSHHPICQSAYHERFSTEDKHASDSCRFCVVCHMMEFLFNDCRKDCTWKHFPTERKIRHHLSRHGALCKLALQRLEVLRTGRSLDPMEI